MRGAAAPAVALVHAPKPRHLTPENGLASFVNFPPFGLFAIASWLRTSGFDAEIVHLGLERLAGQLADLPGHLRRRGTRLIGISLHWHPSTFDAIETARWLKRELGDVRIVFGGITASFFAEQLFGFDCVDHVIEGDGERAMAALARWALVDGARGDPREHVPNLWTRAADGRPLAPVGRHADGAAELGAYDLGCLELVKNRTWLPYMNWALPAEAPWLARAVRAVQQARPRLRPFTCYPGRGCPISCPICGGNREVMRASFGRRGFTPIPPPAFVAMAEKVLAGGFTHLASDMGYGMTDDDLLELFAAFEAARVAPCWSLSVPALPAFAVAESLRRITAGRCWLSLTVESGSERIRRRFRGPAGFSNDELLAFVAACDAAGIPTQSVFSVNLPLDAAGALEHRVETAALKRDLGRFRSSTVVNYNLQLDPGSGMFRDPERFHCRPLWRTLSDYYEANRRPDAGPGFVTAEHTRTAWAGHRTFQVERPGFVVMNTGFRAGGALERALHRAFGRREFDPARAAGG